MPQHPNKPFRPLTWDEFSEETVEEAFMASGMMGSKSEFRRLLAQGGIKISGRKKTHSDDYLHLFDLRPPDDLMENYYAVLRAGKCRSGLVLTDIPTLSEDWQKRGGSH